MPARESPEGSDTAGSTPGRETLLLTAAGLALLMGVQLLRVFLPAATFYLHETLGFSPLVTGLIGLSVLAIGLRAPALVRRQGWWRTVRWMAGAVALARIAEQLAGSAAVDARIAVAGTAFLALMLSLLLLAPPQPPGLRPRLAFVVLVCLGLETALRTLGGTLDLSWQGNGPADLAVYLIAAACLGAVALAGQPAGTGPRPASSPWRWVALGTWLALYLLIFSNPAQLAARAGMPLERASWFVLGSWGLSLLILGVLPLHGGPRWRTLEASGLAALGSWMAAFGGADAWFGVLIGTPGMAVLLFDLLATRSAGGRASLAAGASGMVTLAILYLAYGRFDQPFGPAETVVYLIALALLVGAALTTAWRGQQTPPPQFWQSWLAALAIGAAVAGLAARLLAPAGDPPAAATAGPLRIMTYNLHQGFDIEGNLDPEGLAQVIELEAPDVLALQEVTRGWLVTGGLDLYAWLERRLRTTGRFAGTADPQWGNALLTRLPIRRSKYHPLPPDDLPLRRGVLDVTVQTQRGDLRFLCVHLHHRKADGEIRVRQVDELLRIWGGTPGTVLLGDFNALPGSAAIELLLEAGLRDAAELLPPSGRGTTSDLDRGQIDWIFATPDLAFADTVVRSSEASDHLPLSTTVRFTSRSRGVAPASGAADSRRPPD